MDKPRYKYIIIIESILCRWYRKFLYLCLTRQRKNCPIHNVHIFIFWIIRNHVQMLILYCNWYLILALPIKVLRSITVECCILLLPITYKGNSGFYSCFTITFQLNDQMDKIFLNLRLSSIFIYIYTQRFTMQRNIK